MITIKKLLLAATALILSANISAQSKWFLYYSDGRAITVEGGKYGFIDAVGNEAIPHKYDKAYNFNDGMAMVLRNGELFAIDTLGNRLDIAVTTPKFHRSESDFSNSPNMIEEFVKHITSKIQFDSAEEYMRFRNDEVYSLITIDTNGNTTDLKILSSTSDEAAHKVEDIISAAKWEPGTVGGQPASLTYLIPIKFKWCRYDIRSSYPIDGKGNRIDGNYTEPKYVSADYPSFRSWFFKHYRHKNSDEYYRAAPGKVVARFTIDAKGRLRNAEIVTSHNEACSQTVLRTLKKSPKWTPATVDGQSVAAKYTAGFDIKYR